MIFSNSAVVSEKIHWCSLSMGKIILMTVDAAFLHAAEGGDLDRDDALVNADDAVFERLGDAPDAADVAAVEIGGEAELGVVGHLDRLGLALEAVERRDGPKDLFLGDDHVGR